MVLPAEAGEKHFGLVVGGVAGGVRLAGGDAGREKNRYALSVSAGLLSFSYFCQYN